VPFCAAVSVGSIHVSDLKIALRNFTFASFHEFRPPVIQNCKTNLVKKKAKDVM
jgi:hypothetical protein